MKKLTNVRGASMVEYALLLFAVLIVAAVAIKSLGPKVAAAGDQGAAQLN
jgi:Flp pilus assembly pilin Flp